MRGAALALTLSCAGPSLAQDFKLVTPIDCDLSRVCYIQQFVDRDPGPGVKDYRCESQANDGHSGTDFALPSRAMMEAGVAVRAAAPGVVRGIRDGMPDTGLTADTAPDVKGKECGNGVRVEHGDGWSTQYCHLKMGSVMVRSGQTVAAGETIGLVGKSGAATFPHLHLSVSRNGQNIDPFNPSTNASCAKAGTATLWQENPPYRPGGLISLGLFDRIPEYADVKAGTAHLTSLSRDLPVLALWSYNFATRKGDVLRLSLNGPDGAVIAKDIVMNKPQVLSMRAIGKKRRNVPWPAGEYTGTATLLRDGKALETKEITMRMP